MFDSFVTEGLLVAGMPNVFHWAACYGSAVSLDHLLDYGANLEEKDDVMRHKRYLVHFLIKNFRMGVHRSCCAHAWKMCNGLPYTMLITK